MVLHRPLSRLYLFTEYQAYQTRHARISSVTQRHQRFRQLQQVGNVKDRETKFSPIVADLALICPGSREGTHSQEKVRACH